MKLVLGGPEGRGSPLSAFGRARGEDLESPGGSGIRDLGSDRRTGIGLGSREALEDLTRLRGTQYSGGLGDLVVGKLRRIGKSRGERPSPGTERQEPEPGNCSVTKAGTSIRS